MSHPEDPTVFVPPVPDDIDWKTALANGPGLLWALPEHPEVEHLPKLTEVELAIVDHAVDAYTATLPNILGIDWAGAFRAAWTELRPLLEQRLCDCPRDPYHRWNCPATPIWAQTIRDLDTNPGTRLDTAIHNADGLIQLLLAGPPR